MTATIAKVVSAMGFAAGDEIEIISQTSPSRWRSRVLKISGPEEIEIAELAIMVAELGETLK